MTKNSILLFFILTCFMFAFSCTSQNKNDRNEGEAENYTEIDDSIYFTIKNKTTDIGEIDMIYMFYEYWNGRGNVTIGINNEIIDNRILELFPDSIKSINELYFGYKPSKKIIKQKALNYLARYILNNCDTVAYRKDFKSGNVIYQIYLIGRDGKFECIYGNPNRVKIYFQGMVDWIKTYSDTNAFKDVLPSITPMTKDFID